MKYIQPSVCESAELASRLKLVGESRGEMGRYLASTGRMSTRTCLKKNLNASRPSEHPPVRGGDVKTFLGGIIGCKYKTSSRHLNGFPMVVTLGQQLLLLFLTFSALVANPKKTTLHGGQSRSWSAEQGKEEK